eukprot:TRINITY_DN5900_c0_g1_i2.p1 TRINITY_DN5900_c0_g1~~TRINITY_DN5900_c0_g1_i2.p1  ORF type:complete len:310 (+),score=115.89 TRINITY_DN5900_c0_g1_i2:282-1211(+)
METCVETIIDIVNVCKEQAGMDIGTPLDGLGLSLSGMGTEKERVTLTERLMGIENLASAILVVEDTTGSVLSASNTGGIVLIAGTGSNCEVITAKGEQHRCGGWGHMLGDHGSAYYTVYTALERLFRAVDGQLLPGEVIPDHTWVYDHMLEHFEITHHEQLLRMMYRDFEKSHIAGFCKVLSEGATQGDEFCVQLFKEVGMWLGCMIKPLLKYIGEEERKTEGGFSIVAEGSVFKSFHLFENEFVQHICPDEIAQGDDTEYLDAFKLVTLKNGSTLGAAVAVAQSLGQTIDVDYSEFVDIMLTHTRGQK